MSTTPPISSLSTFYSANSKPFQKLSKHLFTATETSRWLKSPVSAPSARARMECTFEDISKQPHGQVGGMYVYIVGRLLAGKWTSTPTPTLFTAITQTISFCPNFSIISSTGLKQCLPPPLTPSTQPPCSPYEALPVETPVRTRPPTLPGRTLTSSRATVRLTLALHITALRLTHHRLLRRACIRWPQSQALEFHGGAGRAERGAGCESSLGDGGGFCWRALASVTKCVVRRIPYLWNK
jgi:hypothetical protein